MIKIDTKWGETTQSFFEKSLDESNPHLRKRYMAFYLVASGEPCINKRGRWQKIRLTKC